MILLELKTRRVLFYFLIPLIPFLLTIFVVIGDVNYESSQATSAIKLLSYTFRIIALLIFGGEISGGLLNTKLSNGLERKEAWTYLIFKGLLISVVFYFYMMLLINLYGLLDPYARPYIQYLYNFSIPISFLSITIFSLAVALFANKSLGYTVVFGYIILPIIENVPVFIASKIWGEEIKLIGFVSAFEGIMSNDFFIEDWKIYSALFAQILTLTLLIRARIIKMNF